MTDLNPDKDLIRCHECGEKITINEFMRGHGVRTDRLSGESVSLCKTVRPSGPDKPVEDHAEEDEEAPAPFDLW